METGNAWTTLPTGERLADERLRELPAAVGPEVEEDRAVSRANRHRSAAIVDDGRGDELVGDSLGISAADRLRRRCGELTRAVDERIVRQAGPLPAPVAVHREVAPGHRPDAA